MTITEDRHPTPADCPAWCVKHERYEDRHAEDRVLVHRGTKRDVAVRGDSRTYEVGVQRYDRDDSGRTGPRFGSTMRR